MIYLEINVLSVIDWTMSYLWDNLSTQWRQRANKRYSNSHFLPGVTLDNNYIQEYKLIWIFSLLRKKALLTKIALIEEAAALMNRLVSEPIKLWADNDTEPDNLGLAVSSRQFGMKTQNAIAQKMETLDWTEENYKQCSLQAMKLNYCSLQGFSVDFTYLF